MKCRQMHFGFINNLDLDLKKINKNLIRIYNCTPKNIHCTICKILTMRLAK